MYSSQEKKLVLAALRCAPLPTTERGIIDKFEGDAIIAVAIVNWQA
jgi:hypothetical protein